MKEKAKSKKKKKEEKNERTDKKDGKGRIEIQKKKDTKGKTNTGTKICSQCFTVTCHFLSLRVKKRRCATMHVDFAFKYPER